MERMRVAVVTARTSGESIGGAERFYEALVQAFRHAGHEAEEVPVLADEPDFNQIKKNYLSCYDLELSDFDLVVSTKAPTWLVRHPRHVCYLVHTIRVFYDMFETAFPSPSDDLLSQRKLVHTIDTAALKPPRCRAIFSIGHEVAKRLQEWNGLNAIVMHPPLWSNAFRPGPMGDYLLLPGRLHSWKRVDLVIRAMHYVQSPLRLIITGTGEAESELRALAAGQSRVEFRGRISDAELVDLYANAFAVPFTPMREDYGYVTLEAFASGKPVLTCSDSGEAAAIVGEAKAGYVCDPEPEALGRHVDLLWRSALQARTLGERGRGWVTALSWPRIVEQLISAAYN